MTRVQDIEWVEKYRPETLDDIVGQDALVRRLRDWQEDGSLPHILLKGPAGTGKTAVSVAFAQEKFGDSFTQNFLELNASDERGIDIVRDKIKGFARQHPTDGHDYKIVFLDEADQLTKDAQGALRRVIEEYSDRTRFFLSCNFPNQIIDPIQSRTAPFSVERLSDEDIEGLLTSILDEEGIDYDLTEVAEIVQLSKGDARRAIKGAQTAAIDGELDMELIQMDVLDRDFVTELCTLAFSGETDEAMEKFENQIIAKGYATETIGKQFRNAIKYHDDLDEWSRMKCIDALGEAEYRITVGGSPVVQWDAFLSKLCQARHMTPTAYE